MPPVVVPVLLILIYYLVSMRSHTLTPAALDKINIKKGAKSKKSSIASTGEDEKTAPVKKGGKHG